MIRRPPRSTLFPLHDALPISLITHVEGFPSWRSGLKSVEVIPSADGRTRFRDRKSTRLNSSHQIISYAVFCLKKKNIIDACVCNSTNASDTGQLQLDVQPVTS